MSKLKTGRELSHFDSSGNARMVDVSQKADTVREATAAGSVSMSQAGFQLVRQGAIAKGDVLGVERVPSRRQLADNFTVLEKDGHLVGVDGQLRQRRDRLVRVFVDRKFLGLVGPGDHQLLHAAFQEVGNTHR